MAARATGSTPVRAPRPHASEEVRRGRTPATVGLAHREAAHVPTLEGAASEAIEDRGAVRIAVARLRLVAATLTEAVAAGIAHGEAKATLKVRFGADAVNADGLRAVVVVHARRLSREVEAGQEQQRGEGSHHRATTDAPPG